MKFEDFPSILRETHFCLEAWDIPSVTPISSKSRNVGVSIGMGVPPWLDGFMENPTKPWMIWRYHGLETSVNIVQIVKPPYFRTERPWNQLIVLLQSRIFC